MTVLKIALVGAPHTGKSHLAAALAASLKASGCQAVIVVADTPALQAELASYDLTFLMGLACSATSPQDDREAADQSIRAALTHAGTPYRVVYGGSEERLDQVLRTLDGLLQGNGAGLRPNAIPASIEKRKKTQSWVWMCDKCSDPQCEYRLLTDLMARRANPV